MQGKEEDMKKVIHNYISHMIAVFLLMTLFLAIPVCSHAETVCREEDLDSAGEAIQMLHEDWEDSYFEEVLVREKSGKVEVDGEKGKFTDTFSVTTSAMKEAVSSGQKLSEFLEKQEAEKGNIYSLEEAGEGTYSITAPYQSKRIVIYSTEVSDTYGATEKYRYEEGEETILCFASEEDTRDAYEKIKADFGEENCFIDEIFSVNRMAQSVSWGGSVTGMDKLKTGAADSGLASSLTVAVIDTGINKEHEAFSGRTILPASKNIINNSKNIQDTNGHGTHVAGIIADLTPDNVNLLVLKIADGGGTSSALVMNLAINYAISGKADIMNVSYGFLSAYASRYTFLDKAIDKAYKKGIPIVTAAGNLTEEVAGRNVQNCYPACNDQVIAVSALDKNLNLADYSFFGSAVDFSAPGSMITSAWIGSESVLKMESGTSMAAPHITSAFAYIKLRNKKLSVQGTCLELKRYCVDLGKSGKDDKYGYGYPRIGELFKGKSSYDSWTVSAMPKSPVIRACRNDRKGTSLRWKKVAGAAGYYVYRRLNNGVNKKIATVTGNKYTDRKVKEGDYCVYYVVAYTGKKGAVKLSGHSNTAVNVTLRPVEIAKISSGGRKKVSLKRKGLVLWEDKKIQVQYSRKKSFKKPGSKVFRAEKSVCRFGLSRKGTLYVRIRSKFRWEGVTYTSAWSKVKKVKVK